VAGCELSRPQRRFHPRPTFSENPFDCLPICENFLSKIRHRMRAKKLMAQRRAQAVR
jgi:hypothetical protein